MRFLYDAIKLFYLEDFSRLRIDSVKNDHLWYYAIFLFLLIMIIEFIPIVQFILNLDFMYSTPATLSPKERPLLRESQGSPSRARNNAERRIDFDYNGGGSGLNYGYNPNQRESVLSEQVI